jgi:hypothetical protein
MSPSPTPVQINLALHPRQAAALLTPATEVLYGGAAGGGKSHLIRAAAITWCADIPGLQVYLFRRQLPDLIKNHMEGPQGFRAVLAPWVEAGFVEIVEGEIRFLFNGSKIYLCHCKDERDRFNYHGAEIHVLMVDELTHFTSAIYKFLRGRVRMVGVNLPEKYHGMFPRILCGSNPGNVGHLWVKADWIDGAQPMELRQMPDEDAGLLRQYIPARLDDNPSMTRDDPTYRARLRGLGSDSLVRAMELGDWSVVEGAYFDCWRTDKHVVRPFKIPEHWVRICAFDWGSAKPFSVGWWAVAGEDHTIGGQTIPRGAMVRYREWYGAQSPNVGLKMDAEDVARGIARREDAGESIDRRIADPSIDKRDGGPSILERMHRATGGRISFYLADNTRLPGWDQLRARMKGDDAGRPMIYCFSTCLDSIRTIPALQHSELRPEDLDTDGEDHAADEWRYACMARPWARQAPSPPEVAKPFVWNVPALKALDAQRLRNRRRI